MTPFEIRILLHYFTREGDPEEANAPIFQDTVNQFLSDGLIEPYLVGGGATYAITDRGDAYCRALQEVPLPVQKWVMP